MKTKTNILIDKLNELYKLYEEYCWQDKNLEIVVIFDDMAISLYLNDQKHNEDMFTLTFNRYEKKVYEYVSLKFFNLILGDVYIYKDDNAFYNEKHKPYVKVIINNEELLVNVNDLVFNQDMIYIQEGVDDICKHEPFRIYSNKFIKSFDERIDLSKKKLRSRNK